MAALNNRTAASRQPGPTRSLPTASCMCATRMCCSATTSRRSKALARAERVANDGSTYVLGISACRRVCNTAHRMQVCKNNQITANARKCGQWRRQCRGARDCWVRTCTGGVWRAAVDFCAFSGAQYEEFAPWVLPMRLHHKCIRLSKIECPWMRTNCAQANRALRIANRSNRGRVAAKRRRYYTLVH